MSRKDYSSIEVGGDEASGYANRTSDKKVQQLKDHVSEVSNIMQENINKILERGQRLEHLEDRSEILSSRADDFRVSAKRVSRKMWWQNFRVNIIIGVVVVAIIVIIIGLLNQINSSTMNYYSVSEVIVELALRFQLLYGIYEE